MVSTSYPKNQMDWKGVFIKHLADALARRKDINLRLWCPPGEISFPIRYACNEKEAVWLNDLVKRGGIAHILRNVGINRFKDPIKLFYLLRKSYKYHSNIDLFHINWLQNSLPLLELPGKQPALISVLGTDMKLLRLPGMRMLLRQALQQRRCILAPNADWMLPILQELFGDVAEIRTIPFGIDNNWYRLSRGIIKTPHIWLTVSRLTKNKIGPLFEWGKMYFENKHELHLFGPMQEHTKIPPWVHYHGPTYPKNLMNNWFPKATGLITLSRHDEGRPQVMLEAMASSLPIIASRLPAHDSLINHQETGWLVETSKEFYEALHALSQVSLNKTIGNKARNWVHQYIGTWDDCAERYNSAYRTLLENN